MRILELEKHSLGDQSAVGSTYLNISAVLSDMGRFQVSLEFAEKAKDAFVLEVQKEDPETGPSPDQLQTRANLVVVYFNMGFTLEQLQMVERATQVYKEGYLTGVEYLSDEHSVTKKVYNRYCSLLQRSQGQAREFVQKSEDEDPGQGALDAYPVLEGSRKPYLKTRFYLNTSHLNSNPGSSATLLTKKGTEKKNGLLRTAVRRKSSKKRSQPKKTKPSFHSKLGNTKTEVYVPPNPHTVRRTPISNLSPDHLKSAMKKHSKLKTLVRHVSNKDTMMMLFSQKDAQEAFDERSAPHRRVFGLHSMQREPVKSFDASYKQKQSMGLGPPGHEDLPQRTRVAPLRLPKLQNKGVLNNRIIFKKEDYAFIPPEALQRSKTKEELFMRKTLRSSKDKVQLLEAKTAEARNRPSFILKYQNLDERRTAEFVSGKSINLVEAEPPAALSSRREAGKGLPKVRSVDTPLQNERISFGQTEKTHAFRKAPEPPNDKINDSSQEEVKIVQARLTSLDKPHTKKRDHGLAASHAQMVRLNNSTHEFPDLIENENQIFETGAAQLNSSTKGELQYDDLTSRDEMQGLVERRPRRGEQRSVDAVERLPDNSPTSRTKPKEETLPQNRTKVSRGQNIAGLISTPRDRLNSRDRRPASGSIDSMGKTKVDSLLENQVVYYIGAKSRTGAAPPLPWPGTRPLPSTARDRRPPGLPPAAGRRHGPSHRRPPPCRPSTSRHPRP